MEGEHSAVGLELGWRVLRDVADDHRDVEALAGGACERAVQLPRFHLPYLGHVAVLDAVACQPCTSATGGPRPNSVTDVVLAETLTAAKRPSGADN